jgi:geranylgeranyl pyrophosphate synthase
MNVTELLKNYSEQIETLLRRKFPPQTVDFISDGVWYQFSTGGKRLRPALCLLTCEQLGGDVEAALPFALAAEILHNLFLIHDDIEDGDTMRRDRKTLWTQYGLANAINMGDYLTAAAYRILLASPLEAKTILRLLAIYTLTFEKTVEGQALDINHRGSEALKIADYYRIVQLKTAYYLTFNLVGGAIVAGISESVIERLWNLGRHLGPAFQIRDDLIDLTRGKGRGGEIGCDIREGKPSIFFAFALERLPEKGEERKRLLEIIRKPRESTTSSEVQEVMKIYESIGAFPFAEAECQRLITEAYAIIDHLPLDDKGKELFRSISRFMIDRQN